MARKPTDRSRTARGIAPSPINRGDAEYRGSKAYGHWYGGTAHRESNGEVTHTRGVFRHYDDERDFLRCVGEREALCTATAAICAVGLLVCERKFRAESPSSLAPAITVLRPRRDDKRGRAILPDAFLGNRPIVRA